MRDELGGKIMKEFVQLKGKTCNSLTDNNNESKKAKFTKKGIIKRKLKDYNFKDYKLLVIISDCE